MTEIIRRRRRHLNPDARKVIDAISKAMQPREIGVGDSVSWNDHYSGRVLSVDGEVAVIVEPGNQAFGRR